MVGEALQAHKERRRRRSSWMLPVDCASVCPFPGLEEDAAVHEEDAAQRIRQGA